MSKYDTDIVENILADREKTHGSFADHAGITQEIKRIMHESTKWEYLTQ